MTKIKICGITNLEDALLAERLGADYIGFLFASISKRLVDVQTVKSIVAKLTRAKAVGVFLEQSLAEIADIAAMAKLSVVQTSRLIDKKIPGVEMIQTIPVETADDLTSLSQTLADYVLLDAKHLGQFGGLGKTFDWSLLPADRSHLFLAGGIHPGNVKSAIHQNTYAIDLCSGVEASPGKKDPIKLKQLFEEIQHA